VPPVVAKVVGVPEALTGLELEVAEGKRDRTFVLRLPVGSLENSLADLEGVQVVVKPGENDLQDAMELVE
jgi:hypothetical protein